MPEIYQLSSDSFRKQIELFLSNKKIEASLIRYRNILSSDTKLTNNRSKLTVAMQLEGMIIIQNT